MSYKHRRFCRIIDLPETQVLLIINYDEDEDSYKVDVSMDFDGVRLTLGMGFKDEMEAYECMETFTTEQATRIYKANADLINEK